MSTLYELIGVGPTASTAEIEAACIKLGERYRPDKNPGDQKAADMFALFEEALVNLSDPVKRAAYDASIGLQASEIAHDSPPNEQVETHAMIDTPASPVAQGTYIDSQGNVKKVPVKRLVLTALIAGLCLYLLSQESRDLKATVFRSSLVVTIKNEDTFSWGNCKVELNSNYQLTGITIHAGTEFQASTREFTTTNGDRFNPATMKIQKVFIYCTQTPHGSLAYVGKWN